MATRRQPAMRARKTRLDSGLQTKKRKVFFSPSPSLSFCGRRRWRRQQFRSWRRSRRTQGLFSFSVGGGDGEQGPLVLRRRTLQQLLPSAQSDPPPHLALPVCCCEKTLCIFALVYSLAVFLTNCYQVNSWFVPF